jgi:hypothetical protein
MLAFVSQSSKIFFIGTIDDILLSALESINRFVNEATHLYILHAVLFRFRFLAAPLRSWYS